MNLDSAFTEVIPLGNVPVDAEVISPKMLEIIEQNSEKNLKTLIFYNRRWSASAFVCQDCWFFEKCPNCDIAFSYHALPRKRLVCHQCNMTHQMPTQCPRCHGSKFRAVGVGIEQLASTLFQKTRLSVGILDADHIQKNSQISDIIDTSDVLLATNLASLLEDERIGSVIFALFELNFSVPEYDIEEELFAQISYIRKQQKPLYIQTFCSENPLLEEILFGNFRSFLEKLKTERKMFNYPPFVDFVTIRVRHRDKVQVQNILLGLVERIENIPNTETFVAFDKDIWEKSHGEWMQKIILKWKNVSDILEQITSVIVKNRYISVEWH